MGEPRLFCGNRRRLGLEGISFPSQGSLDVPLTSITQENKFELQNIIVALMPGGKMLLTKLSPIPREQDLIYCSKKSPSSCHSYGCFRFNWYFSKYCCHPLSLFVICYSSKKIMTQNRLLIGCSSNKCDQNYSFIFVTPLLSLYNVQLQ